MSVAEPRRALLVSPTEAAAEAAEELRQRRDWVPLAEATMAVALGGDGFMLQTLHAMLEARRILPVFGMNLGTVGFLMNDWRAKGLDTRIDKAKLFAVTPLRMDAETIEGEHVSLPAINEVSLLRETRQTAKLEVMVNGRIVTFPSWCATAFWSRHRQGQPLIICRHRDRSCLWGRRCLR